jgi:hypothetical protein
LAAVAPAQARAIARAIEIEIAGAKDTLATKHDVTQLESRLRVEMGELESRRERGGELASTASLGVRAPPQLSLF